MQKRRRDTLVQAVFALLIAALLVFLAVNLRTNLERLGIGSGVGFLKAPAGFDISFSLTGFEAADTYSYAFWAGFVNTCLASFMGIIGATLIGMTMGVARWSRLPIFSDIGTLYVETFRNIPLLLQIFFWYFAVVRALPSARDSFDIGETVFLNNRGFYFPRPDIEGSGAVMLLIVVVAAIASYGLFRGTTRQRVRTGQRPGWGRLRWLTLAATLLLAVVWFWIIPWELPARSRFGLRGGVEIVPELGALTLGLSLYFGSYVAETVRSGLNGIHHGQREAAASLGLSFRRTLQFILMPQALRNIIPPLANIYLTLVKASALGAAIAYPELLQIANTTLNATGQALEVAIVLVAAYFSLNLMIVGCFSLIERRYRIEKSHG